MPGEPQVNAVTAHALARADTRSATRLPRGRRLIDSPVAGGATRAQCASTVAAPLCATALDAARVRRGEIRPPRPHAVRAQTPTDL
jgi:hypothetical protein